MIPPERYIRLLDIPTFLRRQPDLAVEPWWSIYTAFVARVATGAIFWR
jgi:hypothetical protein